MKFYEKDLISSSFMKFTAEDQKRLDSLREQIEVLLRKKRNWERYQSSKNSGWKANPNSKLRSEL